MVIRNNADRIYFNLCKDILNYGWMDTDVDVRPRWSDGTPAHAKRMFGVVHRYDLQEELPIITLRKVNYKAAIDEILWIYQKKSNNIHDLNSHIWDSWADETGSIGKAYGYQLAQKYQFPEGENDQVDHILYDLKHSPYSRRLVMNLFNHKDLHEMNLYPCAYSLSLFPINGKLNGILNQRSQDVMVANGWNVFQYAVLIHMFAQVSNLKVGSLIHVIGDAHIYDRHIPYAEQLVYPSIETGCSVYVNVPTLEIDPDIKNFYDFTVDSFKVHNYDDIPFQKMKLEVAV